MTVLGFKELYVCSSIDCARLISHFDKELRILSKPRGEVSTCVSREKGKNIP